MDIPEKFSNRFTLGSVSARRANYVLYTGQDERQSNAQVTIKVFTDRPREGTADSAQYNAEVAKLKSVSHPSLAPILDGGTENGWFFLALGHAPGAVLHRHVKANGPFEVDEALSHVYFLGAGLQEIHRQGTYHGHLDSAGVLLGEKKMYISEFCPHIVDRVHEESSSSGEVVFNPYFVAPEQINNPKEANERADVCSLGALAFEMLTGEHAFSGRTSLEVALKRLSDDPPAPSTKNSKIPIYVDEAILRALARNPADRFQTVTEFIDALQNGAGETLQESSSPLEKGLGKLATETIAASVETLREMIAVTKKKEEKTESPKPFEPPKKLSNETIFSMALPEKISKQELEALIPNLQPKTEENKARTLV